VLHGGELPNLDGTGTVTLLSIGQRHILSQTLQEDYILVLSIHADVLSVSATHPFTDF